jgi:hypothetical protein
MSLPQDFWDELPLKSDTELYDMLAHEQDYLPEALAAAKKELGRRNLAPETVAQLETIAQSRKSAEECKAEEPLSWPLRILVFVFLAGLLGALLAVRYDSRGYRRKAADCWAILAASVAFHLLIGLLLIAAH